ncbi:hypothetical protein VTN02DRAFT_3115 [Thermoascus thermophilus]
MYVCIYVYMYDNATTPGWDTLSSHARFKLDPDLPATIASLRPLFTTFPTAFHVRFSPSSDDAKALLLLLPLPRLLNNNNENNNDDDNDDDAAATAPPITAIVLAYFTPADQVSDQVMSAYSAAVAEYRTLTGPAARRCGQSGGGGGGRYADGWAIEEEVEVEVVDAPRELWGPPPPDVEEGSEGRSGRKARVHVALSGWESMDAWGRFRESEEFQENIHLLQMATAIEIFHIACEQRPST